MVARTTSAVCRQLPTFLNCHHAGTDVEPSKPTSTMKPCETTPCTAAGETNEPTSRSAPVFVLQAKLRWDGPPSPQQEVQRRFTELARAEPASSRQART